MIMIIMIIISTDVLIMYTCWDYWFAIASCVLRDLQSRARQAACGVHDRQRADLTSSPPSSQNTCFERHVLFVCISLLICPVVCCSLFVYLLRTAITHCARAIACTFALASASASSSSTVCASASCKQPAPRAARK